MVERGPEAILHRDAARYPVRQVLERETADIGADIDRREVTVLGVAVGTARGGDARQREYVPRAAAELGPQVGGVGDPGLVPRVDVHVEGAVRRELRAVRRLGRLHEGIADRRAGVPGLRTLDTELEASGGIRRIINGDLVARGEGEAREGSPIRLDGTGVAARGAGRISHRDPREVGIHEARRTLCVRQGGRIGAAERSQVHIGHRRGRELGPEAAVLVELVRGCRAHRQAEVPADRPDVRDLTAGARGVNLPVRGPAHLAQ